MDHRRAGAGRSAGAGVSGAVFDGAGDVGGRGLVVDSERRDGPGLTAAERAEGERLVAGGSPAPWNISDNDETYVSAGDGGSLLTDDESGDYPQFMYLEDARMVVWLRNHADALLADSANLARERRRVAAHADVTYAVWHWLQAGACRATEPVALEHVRQAVRAAIAADAPGRGEEGATDGE